MGYKNGERAWCVYTYVLELSMYSVQLSTEKKKQSTRKSKQRCGGAGGAWSTANGCSKQPNRTT